MVRHILKKTLTGKWIGITLESRREIGSYGETNEYNDIRKLYGDLDEVADFLEKNGVLFNEVEIAVMEMEKNDHNYAEFGYRGSFVFSKLDLETVAC